MITLKLFNNLPPLLRKKIAKVVFNHMGERFQEEMSQPFHHNFDYDGAPIAGHWYKLMLSHCTYNKTKNQISVTLTYNI